MGTTDSDTVFGSSAFESQIVVRFRLEPPEVNSVGKFTDVTYSSIDNCAGNDDDYATFFTASPLEIIYTANFGTSWSRYQLRDAFNDPLIMAV